VTDFGLLIARLMMSLVFLLSGLDKALHWSAGLAEIAAAGLPLARWALAATVVTQLGGGLSLALVLWTRLGALALAGFTVVATVLFHDFWNATGSMAAPFHDVHGTRCDRRWVPCHHGDWARGL